MNEAREVQEVLLHLHLDELFAYYLASTIGESVFRGVGRAELNFNPSNLKMSPQEWAAAKKLNLGGGGDVCDEHRNGSIERLRGWSASRLMAKAVGLNDPVLDKMLEEVNWFDSNIDCPETHLASLVKMAKVNMKGADSYCFKWAQRLIKAVHIRMSHGLQAGRYEPTFLSFMDKIIGTKSSFKDDKALKSMKKLIVSDGESVEPLAFSLRNMFESLWRTSQGKSVSEKTREICDDMMLVVQLLYEDQVNFHAAKDMIESVDFPGIRFGIDVWDGQRTKRIRAVAIFSDNPRMHSALWYTGFRLSIVKNSKGNVTILGDIKSAKRDGLIKAMDAGILDLAAMNRYDDLPFQERKTVLWQTLQCRGNSPVDKRWYVGDEEWLALFNATHNHAAEPTKLSLKYLIENAKAAFHPENVKAWKKAHGVPDNGWLKAVRLEEWLKPVSLESDLAI